MSIASDTSPLVALAKADLLSLLQSLYTEVQVPPAVHQELLVKTGPEAPRLSQAIVHFIQVSAVPAVPSAVEPSLANLGEGERQAIALALGIGSALLIDERAGRTAARKLGVQITGTAGVLVAAKQAGLLPQVRPVLEDIRQQGYYLSDAVIEAAAQLAGE